MQVVGQFLYIGHFYVHIRFSNALTQFGRLLPELLCIIKKCVYETLPTEGQEEVGGEIWVSILFSPTTR